MANLVITSTAERTRFQFNDVSGQAGMQAQYGKIISVEYRDSAPRVRVTFEGGRTYNLTKTGTGKTLMVDSVDGTPPNNNGHLATMLGALIQ